ncbi:PfkB family carbohydrate kinase [Rhizobium rhizoryzae]|uniref:PfkB family carbohydrate kinase n=1 Tax=Rhizobium rhizoryzae TaxID=451876 RepID=UPI0028AD0488|nr:PfkB family carbohydrate kinase [Rhizobium rhizoryzae]
MGTSLTSRILCVGDNTVDIFVDRKTMYPGGNAVNVAVGVRRLGAQSHYIGCISEDRYGELVYQSLKDEGVDLSLCRRASGPSPKALIGHRGSDRYFIGSMPGVRADYELGDADYALMTKVDIVHTSFYSGLDGKLAQMAKASKILAYDFSNKWLDRHLEQSARFVDIAFISAPARDEAACVELMGRWTDAGAKIVVMTRGEDGSLAMKDGKAYRQGIIAADVVDTLGAGDGFIAGFLTSYAGDADIQAALAMGAQSAARACQQMGGYGHGAEHPWEIPDLPSAGHQER